LIGPPVTAFSSASITPGGKVSTALDGALWTTGGFLGGALLPPLETAGGDECGDECGSSPELQLEIPRAATSDSTMTVNATRAGVHNVFPLLMFVFVAMSC
jgi:hypothetical protein